MEKDRNPDETDWSLVQECVRGDPAAWKRFLHLHARWILYLIHQTLKRSRTASSAQDAEDLLQDVLTYLVQNDFLELRKFPKGYTLKGWLRVAIAGRCYPFLRKKRPLLLPESEIAAILPEGTPSTLAESIDSALRKLPLRDRLLLTLFHLAGHSYEEIAQSLGIPAPQVGVLLERARARLKEFLQSML